MASVFGKNIIVSLFGESHGECVGITADGFPAGVRVDFNYIKKFMDRRKPRLNAFSTSRLEDDEFKVLSGITNGCTNGAPMTAVIFNKKNDSGDYKDLSYLVRPSHADYTARIKFNGYSDLRGGGHLSGRLMAPICFLGALCKSVLEQKGIKIAARLFRVGNICDVPFDINSVALSEIEKIPQKEIPVISDQKGIEMKNLVEKVRKEKDSIGGVIECICLGVPAGIGSPHFDGIENRISAAMFGIPAVKGIEFGSGFAGARSRGSVNNDEFCVINGEVKTKSNNCGGILGGISNGMPIVFKVAVKPTASIGLKQGTVDVKNMKNCKITVMGRHDSCIAYRALPCVEAMASIVLLDMLLG